MKTMPSIGLLTFMALFFAVGFGVLGHGVWSLLQANRAKSWPTTPGRVENCTITESTDAESETSYTVEVDYSYTVNNRMYAGNRIAFGYSGSSGRPAHAEIAARLQNSRSVLVRYDPANPANAALSYGLNRSTIFTLLFGATWLVFTAGFAAMWFMFTRSDAGILNTLITTP